MATSKASKAQTKTIGAPSPNLGVGAITTNGTPKAEKAESEQVDFSTKEFPLTLVATNDSPIPVYLNEVGVMLQSNFEIGKNSAIVTFPTADHLAREIANIESIAAAHGFEDVLQLSEVDEASDGKADAAPAQSEQKEPPADSGDNGTGENANTDATADAQNK